MTTVTCQHCNQPTAANRACRHCGAPPGDVYKPAEVELDPTTEEMAKNWVHAKPVQSMPRRRIDWIMAWALYCMVGLAAPLVFENFVGIDKVLAYPWWFWAITVGPAAISAFLGVLHMLYGMLFTEFS